MTDETGGKPLMSGALSKRTRQRNECPAPNGACSHPEICESHGCAALEVRRNKAKAMAEPTAALTELLAAAEEAIETITKSVDNAASFSRAAPHIRAQVTWTYTNRLRAAVARVRGE